MSFDLTFEPAPARESRWRRARIPWDADLFGLEVFEIRAEGEEVSPELERDLARLLERAGGSARLTVSALPVGANDLGALLARNGFYPVETSFDLSLSLGRLRPLASRRPASLRLRKAGEADRDALRAIARGAFRSDRFHLDPNLDDALADERYARWIERALSDGDRVFVCEDGRDGVGGFYHVREVRDVRPRTVDLCLAAVDASLQRSGLGPLFYQAVVEECRESGFRVAETKISAANVEVLNLFAALGFTFRRPRLWFHRFDRPG